MKEGVAVASVRQQLIQFIEEGPGIFRELDAAPTNVTEEAKRKFADWVMRVRTYLEQNFVDPPYALRFKNFTGLPPAGVIPYTVHSFSDEYAQVRASLLNRLARLHQFLDTLNE